MQLSPAPDLDDAVALLDEVGLPTSDVDAALLKHFFGVYENGDLVGLGGLELYPPVALLRSVVTSPRCRGRGVARIMVQELEAHAERHGVTEIFLLTTDADAYFAAQEYRVIARDEAPQSIRETEQYARLCPGSSTLMVKRLSDRQDR
jgi:amino-acid N-acetyltransferase